MVAERVERLLTESAKAHRHACPRQVLGIRLALLAGERLGLELPRDDRRLLVITETDGCMVDGVMAATHCQVGRRTLRVEDFGVLAATFIDAHSEQAVRIRPRSDARERARAYAPEARSVWRAQLLGYQRMPADELLKVQDVRLKTPLAQLISRPRARAVCAICGDEIRNEREIVHEGLVLCRSCAGQSYYEVLERSTD